MLAACSGAASPCLRICAITKLSSSPERDIAATSRAVTPPAVIELDAQPVAIIGELGAAKYWTGGAGAQRHSFPPGAMGAAAYGSGPMADPA